MSIALVLAGTAIAVLILALVQMAVLRKKEMAVAGEVVKALSSRLDASEKSRIATDKKLLEASMRLVLCEKANDKLRAEKLRAWNIPDKY